MKIINLIFILLCIFLSLVISPSVYHWILISGGDYTIFTETQAHVWRYFSFSSWNDAINLGWSIIPLISYAPYTFLIGWINSICGSNGIIFERFFLWLPFLIFGFSGSLFLARKLSGKISSTFLAPIIFIFNTYILLLLSGGQIAGVGLAYAFSPFVLVSYLSLFEKPTIKNSIITGMLLAISLMFDLRMTYVTLVGVGVYLIIQMIFAVGSIYRKSNNARVLLRLSIFIFPGILVVLLHAYWVIAMAIFRDNPLATLGSAYNTTHAVQFFSFAKFENALGLLHPNWPENIFGKTYFMRPEFLLLPILAFGSLLFVKKTQVKEEQKRNRNILFFALLGIIGIFLAKGAQDPFGGVYIWLFNHVPGFVMFRDPTKWYLIVALSYAVLIPFTVSKVGNYIKSKINRVVSGMFFVLVICYLLFLIRPALLGQLGGTFQIHTIPWEYQKFSTELDHDKSFGRVLWVPSPQSYAYYSPNHPRVSDSDLFQTTNIKSLLGEFMEPSSQILIQNVGVKYVVFPYDSEKEIFLTDRKYDRQQYKQAVSYLKKISWLKQINGYGQLAIFVVTNPKDHFWASDTNATVSYHFVSPTEYTVSVQNARKGDRLIFAESYNSHWTMQTSKGDFVSMPYDKQLNSFVMPVDGSFTGLVVYTPQKWVNIGIWVSGITACLLVLYLLVTTFKHRRK